jgi:hypothetical protein
VNDDNLSNVRWEASRHFRSKKREYLKDKINEFESDSKKKNIRQLYKGINEFNEVYQPKTNVMKDESSDLLVDHHKILNGWKDYFCQLLNVHGVGCVRQTEMHTAEPSVPEASVSEVQVAIGKLKRYKSPGVEISAELIQTGRKTLHSEIHRLLSLSGTKNCLSSGKSQLFTKRAIKLTVAIIKAYHCCKHHKKFYQHSSL